MEEEAQFLRDDAEIKFKAQDFAGALWVYNSILRVHVAAYESSITTFVTSRTAQNTVKYTKVKVPDWYTMLEIFDDSADTDTIKKQYKRMALLVHPDKNGSIAAESAFKLIQDANEILSDPITRMGFELKRNRSKPPPPTPTASTSSTKASTKPSVNRHDDKSKYKSVWGQSVKNGFEPQQSGQSSSYYYDDCEYAEDTWPDEEEDEEDVKYEIKPCPTCCYPCYAQTYERMCSSILTCKHCDRKFMFSQTS
ncbi:hypothetical protein MKW92_025309 [Papaver armeniacum]|nr:hypothetical protein MKW92_025309 [Papaver armeniacum]